MVWRLMGQLGFAADALSLVAVNGQVVSHAFQGHPAAEKAAVGHGRVGKRLLEDD